MNIWMNSWINLWRNAAWYVWWNHGNNFIWTTWVTEGIFREFLQQFLKKIQRNSWNRKKTVDQFLNKVLAEIPEKNHLNIERVLGYFSEGILEEISENNSSRTPIDEYRNPWLIRKIPGEFYEEILKKHRKKLSGQFLVEFLKDFFCFFFWFLEKYPCGGGISEKKNPWTYFRKSACMNIWRKS